MGELTLNVYNAQGALVSIVINNVWMNSGNNDVQFSAKGLSDGVYIYSIQAVNYGYSRKMVVN